ncbi:DUF3540 domain-containing protein [Sorangium sp. So ce861]|uniref:DUF3540 domain-containing protein n=1 Tax=Sorangium sp. So ce861 TaxID=3133323 RepID=UPI003F5F8242
MDNRARKLEINTAEQEVATVIAAGAGGLVVRASSGDYRSRRAASCLLAPAVGDLVLVAILSSGGVYVLAVLDRKAGAPGAIAYDGDLRVELPAGRLELAAQEGVGVVSGKDVSVAAGEVAVKAARGSLLVQGMSIIGGLLSAEIDTVKVVAGALDSALDRLSQRVKRSYRFVEEVDQVKAEQIDYAAKKMMRLHAGNALMSADELVKLDGEQIHVG